MPNPGGAAGKLRVAAEIAQARLDRNAMAAAVAALGETGDFFDLKPSSRTGTSAVHTGGGSGDGAEAFRRRAAAEYGELVACASDVAAFAEAGTWRWKEPGAAAAQRNIHDEEKESGLAAFVAQRRAARQLNKLGT